MKKILFIALTICTFSNLMSQTSDEKNAILGMAGTFSINFDFIETFSNDSNYQLAKKYHASAKEMVMVTENTAKKITLSHFLVVNDTIIIKHWRQDWIYENTEFLAYQGNNTWKKHTKAKADVKGTWTQKVFQVDESPRYEAYGTWVKQDGEMIWNSSNCMSPLPRRELSVREDYNVIQRRSRIVVAKDYWYIEQDNYKLNNDTILCHEKGMERFERHAFDTEKIMEYWKQTEKVWRIVIQEWQTISEKNNHIQLNGRLIRSDYQAEIFGLVGELSKGTFKDTEIKEKITTLIIANCVLKNI